MNRKTVVSISLLFCFCVGLHFGGKAVLGFSPWRIGDAIGVATGMGAKLACSGYFVVGQSKHQIIDDLASYSPVNKKLVIHYDDINLSVSASLFGLGEMSAHYRKGLGCTLNVGDSKQLDGVTVPPLSRSKAPWPMGASAMALNTDRQRLVDDIVTNDNALGYQTRALLVVENGEIVAESYAEDFGPETPQMGWSMAKSLTAIMLGRMEYLGIADMDTAALFTQWESDARQHIALKDLLQMSSGLVFDETYAPGSDSTYMLFGANSASDVALNKPAGHEPGTRFSYSSGTSNILMRWMHDHLGGAEQSVDFLYQSLYEPLGMRHTILEPDPSGVFVASSFVYASARDWGRLGLLMLNKGEINGRRILSEEWVERAVTPNDSKNNTNYGFQFWLNQRGGKQPWPSLPEDTFYMSGNRKQFVVVVPSKKMVVVRLGWTKGRYPIQENISTILASSR